MTHWNHPSTAKKLGLTVLSVTVVAVVIKILSLILPVTPTVLFASAITLATIYGGIKFGLLGLFATVLTINFFFIPPLHRLTLAEGDLFRLLALAITLPVAVYIRSTFAEKISALGAEVKHSADRFLR